LLVIFKILNINKYIIKFFKRAESVKTGLFQKEGFQKRCLTLFISMIALSSIKGIFQKEGRVIFTLIIEK